MSVAGTLALSIRANTEKVKQDLKPALDAIKEWGVAAEKAGLSTSEVNREMAKMRAEASRGPKAVAESTNTLQQNLQKAKMGAAALSGAISAMSSEVGGTVGHVTRLGTSLTSAFLAGGPIALGVTALAAGISAIAGASNEAAKAAEEARKAHVEWLNMTAGRAQDYASEVEALSRKLAALRGGDEERRSYEAWVRERTAVASLNADVAKLVERTKALASAKVAQAEAEKLAAEARFMGKMDGGFGVSGVEDKARKAAEETAKIEREVKEFSERIAKQRETILSLTRDIAKEEAKVEKSSKGAAESHAKSAASIKDVLAGARSWNELGSDIAKDAERINKAMNAELAQQINSAYGRMAKDHADALAAAEGQAKAAEEIAKASESAASSAKEMATAAEVRAESEKIVTEQVREQSRLVAKRLDITKRFSNVGGSMFGFGAGQVGTGIGDIGGDANRARRAAGDIPGKGGGLAAQIASGKGLQLPDVSAQIKALEAEIAKVPPLFERLSGAVTGFGATTKAAVVEMGKSTERAVGNIRSQTDALRAEVRSLSKAIERAGNGTGVGD